MDTPAKAAVQTRARLRAAAAVVASLALLAAAANPARAAEPPSDSGFQLRDGDVVCFLGDGVTAAGGWTALVENYTLLRHPKRRVRFVNAALPGETAASALCRLERDVLPHKPTVLVLALGFNDIGRGARADAERRRVHIEAVKAIAALCESNDVRLHVCSPPPTAVDPAADAFLADMGADALRAARALGVRVIDVHASVARVARELQRARADAPPGSEIHALRIHADDGFHLEPLGELAMARAVLRGLGASPEVSRAVLRCKPLEVVESPNCRVQALVSMRDGHLEFDRLDAGLPLALGSGPAAAALARLVPFPDELARYELAVRGLPQQLPAEPRSTGRYEVLADGRRVGAWTADELARGVNLAQPPAEPRRHRPAWEARARALARLTDARAQLENERRDAWSDSDFGARGAQVDLEALAAARARIETLQRDVVRPRAIHFEIRPETEPETPTRPQPDTRAVAAKPRSNP